MTAKFTALAAAVLAVASIAGAQAAEPKHGGILHIYHRETPPSLSIHEEATFSVNVPAMPIFSNLVIYDQHKPQNSMGTIELELGQGEHGAHLQAAARREMARRPAVHRQGREVHLRSSARQGAGQVPQESAQGLVCGSFRRHRQRRLRSDLPPQAAATV